MRSKIFKVKFFVILFLVIPFSGIIFGQVMPEAFLGMTPKIPVNACLKDIDIIDGV